MYNQSMKEKKRDSKLKTAFFHLISGGILFILLASFQVGHYIQWFITTIIHESGHLFISLYSGCPALPAIRLDGHGACLSVSQNIPLTILIFLMLCPLCKKMVGMGSKMLQIFSVFLMTLFLLLAFIPSFRHILRLYAGHGNELIFAIIFFIKAFTGLTSSGGADRTVSAAMGWYITVRNLKLTFGILFNSQIRAAYYVGGSFGLTNDYIRISNFFNGLDMIWVLLPIILLALAVIPLSGILSWLILKEKYLSAH